MQVHDQIEVLERQLADQHGNIVRNLHHVHRASAAADRQPHCLIHGSLAIPRAGGTTVVWPYVELARAALQAGRASEAAELCRRGLDLALPHPGKAVLLQLLAIAMLRLDEPVERVRAVFRRAAELDPLTPEIRTNAQAFERFAADPASGEPDWQLHAEPPAAALADAYAHLLQAAA